LYRQRIPSGIGKGRLDVGGHQLRVGLKDRLAVGTERPQARRSGHHPIHPRPMAKEGFQQVRRGHEHQLALEDDDAAEM
jgi:hypothetical protein